MQNLRLHLNKIIILGRKHCVLEQGKEKQSSANHNLFINFLEFQVHAYPQSEYEHGSLIAEIYFLSSSIFASSVFSYNNN